MNWTILPEVWPDEIEITRPKKVEVRIKYGQETVFTGHGRVAWLSAKEAVAHWIKVGHKPNLTKTPNDHQQTELI
jgi:hypothetical protein